MSQKNRMPTAAELELLYRERERKALERAQATEAVVKEEIGKLIDASREDPDLQIDEEDTSVRRLAKATGRSGSMRAVTAPESSPKPPSR